MEGIREDVGHDGNHDGNHDGKKDGRSARWRLQTSSLEPEMREWRMVGRWMVFFFAVSVIAISVIALGFAAFVVH